MHDVALHLNEQVIPSVPLRQWVLTVPRALRFSLARDRALRRAVTNITVRSIFVLQRRQARAEGFAEVMPAAVTFLHEAGSALNLNPHTHSLVPTAYLPSLGGTSLRSLCSTPPSVERAARGLMGLFTRSPPGLPSRRWQGLPGSWGNPGRLCRALRPRPGPPRLALSARRCCPSLPFTSRTPVSTHYLSRLDHTASALAVYASQAGSPRRHARLASGWWLAFARRDSHRGVPCGWFQSSPT